jgi:hypothetical protein
MREDQQNCVIYFYVSDLKKAFRKQAEIHRLSKSVYL